MHCDYNHPYTLTNARIFFTKPQIIHTYEPSYMLQRPQGNINKKEYKIHPIYICSVINIMATVMKMWIYLM